MDPWNLQDDDDAKTATGAAEGAQLGPLPSKTGAAVPIVTKDPPPATNAAQTPAFDRGDGKRKCDAYERGEL